MRFSNDVLASAAFMVPLGLAIAGCSGAASVDESVDAGDDGLRRWHHDAGAPPVADAASPPPKADAASPPPDASVPPAADAAPPAHLPMPGSEESYPGASATHAFVAMEPFVLNIQDVSKTISLGGASRTHDFSGPVPFVNPTTGKNDPFVFQAWSSGLIDWYGAQITNAGVPGRLDKRTFGGEAVTLVKYNAGDDIAYEKCRSKIGAFPVPPRTHARWELAVAFGNADGDNDWTLTTPGASPVLFWQLRSNNQSNPPLGLDVDTDSADPTKLMISVFQRVGTQPQPVGLGEIHGLPRNTIIPITMDAFLDERDPANGGKGLWQVWVNGALIVEKVGPTLSLGPNIHEWSIETYLWNEPKPYPYSRATFWKTAKMMVFPAGS